MPVCFTVELLNGTFRGRSGDQTATAWPPSPVRLIGALLSGAHNLDGADPATPSGPCASARRALETVIAAPPPIIVTPEEPLELAGGTTWFAPRTGDGEAIKKLVEAPGVAASSNRTLKPRTVSLLPVGSVIRYYVDADIADGEQWEALCSAAHSVPYFGSSVDHAQVTVERVEAEPEYALGGHVWGPLAPDSNRTGRALRTWTRETLAWFDDVHRAGGESIADWRITTTTYAHVAPTPGASIFRGCGDFHMLTLNSPITLREFASRVAGEPEWVGADIFPAVEFNAPDRVRGFGLYGAGTGEALAAAPADLAAGADAPGSFTSWNRSTWCGPARVWQSATAAADHRDARVARKQLDADLRRYGLRLTEISSRPFTRWHSKRLSVPPNYGLWFVTAECAEPQEDPIAGPVRIGECLSSGAGLMTPCRPR